MYERGIDSLTDVNVRRDVDMILWSMRLYGIRRFHGQRFWEAETQESDFAARIEPFPRLESVAEHSWHVADIVMLLAPYFRGLNLDRCTRLALLHDKMEIATGDSNPVGRDGTGTKTHAFNEAKRLLKSTSERDAVVKYLARLNQGAGIQQAQDLNELLEATTQDSRFVKAVDKLQALAYVLIKKGGIFDDRHLRFTLRYSQQCVEYFPPLIEHYNELRSRLMSQVARRRNIPLGKLVAQFEGQQLPLPVEARTVLPNIGLHGRTGSGKTTVAEYLVAKYGYFRCTTGKAVREISKALFQTEAKTVLNRITDCMRAIDESVWIRAALATAPVGQPIVFDCVRYSNDYEQLNSQRLWTRGQDYDPNVDEYHLSETQIDDFEFHHNITNLLSNKSSLYQQVDNIMNDLRQDDTEAV
jgi:5'-deoxynucleotidase YfbR-like HD superfamily hydrolase